jgi:hypothetical protein
MPAFFAPEHKSSPAPELLDQLLYYYVHTRTAWRQSHRDHPLVFLVVLHHGRRRFRAASTLRLPRAFDPDTAVALQRLQPHVPFVLDDLTLCREQDILARPLPPLLRLAMLSLQFLPGCTDQAALAAIERWGALLHSVSIGVEGDPVPGQLAIETIASSFLRVTDLPPERVAAAIAAVTQPRDWSVIMSTYDRAVAEGRVLGKLEGKAQGQAELCLRLLTARFGSLPESIQARVRSGSDVDFERWALRLLDAASLAEVFAHE